MVESPRRPEMRGKSLNELCVDMNRTSCPHRVYIFQRVDSQEETESSELGFTKIGGVFVVLVFGCLIAFVFSILEFLWNIRKVAIEEEVRKIIVISS